MKTWIDKWREEGEIRGEIRGEIKGEKKGILSVARNMIAKGLSDSLILETTGLSRENLERLKMDPNAF